MIPEKTIRALNIIKDNDIYRPRYFAEHYFKGLDILTKSSNIGNGSTQGVGSWFAAGRILSQLKKDNLIRGGLHSVCGGPYELTQLGKEYLLNNS